MTASSTATWLVSRRAFLLGLACAYAIAFLSLQVQLDGLFGSDGIAPLAETMERLREGSTWSQRLRTPTVLWLGASDEALHATCVAGLLAALAIALGVLPRLVAWVAWGAYLSFVSVGYPFLAFQWDALMLEAGLLAALYAPRGLFPFREVQPAPSRLVRFLLLWLLFRLMLESGLVKLASEDPAWRDLTALRYHYWTQPLPNRFAHRAHHLPDLVGKASVAVMFAIELGAPFLLLLGRRARRAGLAAFALLMAGIGATGNYGFFNVLSVVLCLPLLDDRALRRVFPSFRERDVEEAEPRGCLPLRLARGTVLVAFAVLSLLTTSWRAGWLPELPPRVEEVLSDVAAFHSTNAYGLFADMTEERPEIVIEGSDDGERWTPYRFRYKPGDPNRPPTFAGVHMPRLDWQMWFAALQGAPPPWYWRFVQRLLEGEPAVLELLAPDAGEPFGPDRAPRFVRSTLWLYTFSSPAERRSGTWWRRERKTTFGPVLTLDDEGRMHGTVLPKPSAR